MALKDNHHIESIDRKKDHIDLAFSSQVLTHQLDDRFDYEPMLAGHPDSERSVANNFMANQMSVPIWVSSMTGGTGIAKNINQNLARACKQFGMGMGLGSCRPILDDLSTLTDFDVRSFIGDQPLYANLGIAQIEELLDQGKSQAIIDVVNRLSADGLIVHVNPLQEWLQPEGDLIKYAPIDTIARLIDLTDLSIIVKEVGQGFGPASLLALMKMPLTAIEFAASGGTNFSVLEMARSDKNISMHKGLSFIGHGADQMVEIVNQIINNKEDINCNQFIISGGVKSYLDGYYLINKINSPAVYGQASSFLKHAQNSYEELETYVNEQIAGLKLAQKFLRIKTK